MQTDACGNSLSQTGTPPTPLTFAGQWQYQGNTDSSLMLLGNGYYDPEAGRFLSKDPIKAGDNWYAYCDNNPLNGVDPEGLQKAESKDVKPKSGRKEGGKSRVVPGKPIEINDRLKIYPYVDLKDDKDGGFPSVSEAGIIIVIGEVGQLSNLSKENTMFLLYTKLALCLLAPPNAVEAASIHKTVLALLHGTQARGITAQQFEKTLLKSQIALWKTLQAKTLPHTDLYSDLSFLLAYYGTDYAPNVQRLLTPYSTRAAFLHKEPINEDEKQAFLYSCVKVEELPGLLTKLYRKNHDAGLVKILLDLSLDGAPSRSKNASIIQIWYSKPDTLLLTAQSSSARTSALAEALNFAMIDKGRRFETQTLRFLQQLKVRKTVCAKGAGDIVDLLTKNRYFVTTRARLRQVPQ